MAARPERPRRPRQRARDTPAAGAAGDRPALVIRALTPSRWPALEDLFGRPGASNGCWCMYWRIGPAYRERGNASNRRALRRLVERGPPPGLLAFDGPRAVGWCALSPRSELAWLGRFRILGPVDDVPVWSISCFFIRRGHRHKGATAALIAGAVAAARRAGAPAVEAYPWDAAYAPGCAFTGYASTFERLGFRRVACRKEGRPILRYDLAPRAR